MRSSTIASSLIISMFWLASCTAGPTSVSPEAELPSPSLAATNEQPSVLIFTTPTQMPPSAISPSELKAMNAELIAAAEAGDIAVVTHLLQAGVDVNATDGTDRTAVMAATHANQVEIVRMLIEAGADINIRDNRLDNPFLYASAEGLFEIVKLCIDANADTRLTNRFGGTALIPAAERGHIEIVRELLTHTDVDVNHVNNLGWTALMEAIVLSDGGPNHQQIVQLLVEHGANIYIPDKNGITPLQHAQARGFKEIETILLATAQKRDLQMIRAAGIGDLVSVKKLLALGASVHAQDENEVTALIAAAYRNDLPIVTVLIPAGADVNRKDNTQQSAFLISTSEGYLELLQLTLQAGADVHSTDSYNGTALIRAADRGHVEIIEELLKTNINIDHVNKLGWTALLEAIILGDGGQRHTEVVRLLVEAGANVNLADSDGVTPLAHARQRGYEQMTQILLQAGAH